MQCGSKCILLLGFLAFTARASWEEQPCSACSQSCGLECGENQICKMDFDPSVPRSEGRSRGQCALHKNKSTYRPGAGFFIALACALTQCVYGYRTRKRRQASELLRGQRVVGRILKKTTYGGEGVSYDVDYSFPVGQRWFSTAGQRAFVSEELYGTLTEQGAADVLFFAADPRFCMLEAEAKVLAEAKKPSFGLLGSGFGLLMLVAPHALFGYWMADGGGPELAGRFFAVYLPLTLWQVCSVICPMSPIFCCSCVFPSSCGPGARVVDRDPAITQAASLEAMIQPVGVPAASKLERTSELVAFYQRVDPEKLKNGKLIHPGLLDEYDLPMLSAMLRNKYGSAPEGWEAVSAQGAADPVPLATLESQLTHTQVVPDQCNQPAGVATPVQSQVMQATVVQAAVVQQPAPMLVTVPAEMTGGQVLQITTPSGQLVQVQIPAGLTGGQQFQATV
jgi:hypothetical protein